MNPITATTQQQPGLSTASPENKPSADTETSKYLPGATDADKCSQTSLVNRKTEPAPETPLNFAPLALSLSHFAKNHMLVPALLTTPATTSLLRPLVLSQQNGELPRLTAALSTAGWAPAMARTFTRYAIADTFRAASSQLLYGVSSTRELPEEAQDRANFAVNSSSAALMTVASQPFTAMQIKQQVNDRSVKKTEGSKTILPQGVRHTMMNLFRGAPSNCLSTLLMFTMDTMDRQHVKQRNEGRLTDFEMKAKQFGVGATAGLINNFLKTHANARILGRTHQEIYRQLSATAATKPQLFLVQAGYAALMGGITNPMWGSTLSMLSHTDRKITEYYATDTVDR